MKTMNYLKSNLPLHIIIDGADKLGKTTVVNMLSRKLNLPIIKMPNSKEYIKKGTIEEMSRLFNETIVQFAEFSFIMDRGFTSSIVYSKLEDRKIDLGYLRNIENILKPKIFVLTGSIKNEDDVYSNEDQLKINDIFEEIVLSTRSYGIKVDNLSPFDICQKIITYLEEEFQG